MADAQPATFSFTSSPVIIACFSLIAVIAIFVWIFRSKQDLDSKYEKLINGFSNHEGRMQQMIKDMKDSEARVATLEKLTNRKIKALQKQLINVQTTLEAFEEEKESRSKPKIKTTSRRSPPKKTAKIDTTSEESNSDSDDSDDEDEADLRKKLRKERFEHKLPSRTI